MVFFSALLFFVSPPLPAQETSQDAAQTSEQTAAQSPGEASPPAFVNNTDNVNNAAGASGQNAGNRTASGFPGEESIVLGEGEEGAPDEGISSVTVVLRMVLALALAALAIYGVVFFIKRLARPPQNRDPHLKILASVPLGNGAFAAVLSVGSKAWLVGGGDGGVNLISEIDEQEALESMLIDDARKEDGAQGSFQDFRSLLRRLTGKGRSVAPGGTKGGTGTGNVNLFDSHAESLRRQRGRLKGL